jgi:predicted glycoside hydrolase/deacetylase ChbG (UPF0249 family)
VSRHLIVNADDFGLSAGVNAGVVAAYDNGIVTSASLMVRWPAAAEASTLAASRPQLALGLHIDLGEWQLGPGGDWYPRYSVISTDDAVAVTDEVARQVAAFEELTGTPPTHLDGHQHVQRSEPVAGVLRGVARELGVPLRMHERRVRYCGDFYGQDGGGDPHPEGISVDNLMAIIASLRDGWTELGCHPGLGVGPDTSSYGDERAREVQSLCAPEVFDAIERHGITLASFIDLAVHGGS